MQTSKIDQREFEGIVELAVNSGSGNVLPVIATNLARKLGVEETSVQMNDSQDTGSFEKFIGETIDEHGLNFTGADAVEVVREWIRNNAKVSVPAYQKKIPIL